MGGAVPVSFARARERERREAVRCKETVVGFCGWEFGFDKSGVRGGEGGGEIERGRGKVSWFWRTDALRRSLDKAALLPPPPPGLFSVEDSPCSRTSKPEAGGGEEGGGGGEDMSPEKWSLALILVRGRLDDTD